MGFRSEKNADLFALKSNSKDIFPQYLRQNKWMGRESVQQGDPNDDGDYLTTGVSLLVLWKKT